MTNSGIKLVSPEIKKPTINDEPFYRMEGVKVGLYKHDLDARKLSEDTYDGPLDWIASFAKHGWKLPSLMDYQGIFSALYDLRESGNEDVEKSRNSFSRDEFEDSTHNSTSTVIRACKCGDAKVFHSYGQPDMAVKDFPGFAPGRIGAYPDHEDALEALLGTSDVDRVAKVWEWVAGRENISLLLGRTGRTNRDSQTVTLGYSFSQGSCGLGIVVDDYFNVGIKARAFRKVD